MKSYNEVLDILKQQGFFDNKYSNIRECILYALEENYIGIFDEQGTIIDNTKDIGKKEFIDCINGISFNDIFDENAPDPVEIEQSKMTYIKPEKIATIFYVLFQQINELRKYTSFVSNNTLLNYIDGVLRYINNELYYTNTDKITHNIVYENDNSNFFLFGKNVKYTKKDIVVRDQQDVLYTTLQRTYNNNLANTNSFQKEQRLTLIYSQRPNLWYIKTVNNFIRMTNKVMPYLENEIKNGLQVSFAVDVDLIQGQQVYLSIDEHIIRPLEFKNVVPKTNDYITCYYYNDRFYCDFTKYDCPYNVGEYIILGVDIDPEILYPNTTWRRTIEGLLYDDPYNPAADGGQEAIDIKCYLQSQIESEPVIPEQMNITNTTLTPENLPKFRPPLPSLDHTHIGETVSGTQYGTNIAGRAAGQKFNDVWTDYSNLELEIEGYGEGTPTPHSHTSIQTTTKSLYQINQYAKAKVKLMPQYTPLIMYQRIS